MDMKGMAVREVLGKIIFLSYFSNEPKPWIILKFPMHKMWHFQLRRIVFYELLFFFFFPCILDLSDSSVTWLVSENFKEK